MDIPKQNRKIIEDVNERIVRHIIKQYIINYTSSIITYIIYVFRVSLFTSLLIFYRNDRIAGMS